MVTLLTYILTFWEIVGHLEEGAGDLQVPTFILHCIDRSKPLHTPNIIHTSMSQAKEWYRLGCIHMSFCKTLIVVERQPFRPYSQRRASRWNGERFIKSCVSFARWKRFTQSFPAFWGFSVGRSLLAVCHPLENLRKLHRRESYVVSNDSILLLVLVEKN